MTTTITRHRPASVKATRNKFTIPVFPHVKKFIQKSYGTAEAIKVEEYNTLGKLVTGILRDNRKRADNNDQYRDRVTSSITIVLTKEQAELSPRITKLLRINIDMDRVFKEHLVTTIQMYSLVGIAPFNACKLFLEHYGIDEKEYSVEAAYKYWQRCKNQNIPRMLS